MQNISIKEAISAPDLVNTLSRFRYRYPDEKILQNGIEQVLIKKDIDYKREPRLNSKDRPDFIIQDDIVLEVKIKGSVAECIRQIDRYLENDSVSALILIGTPHWISNLPDSLRGKPIYRLRITESMI